MDDLHRVRRWSAMMIAGMPGMINRSGQMLRSQKPIKAIGKHDHSITNLLGTKSVRWI
jgi:hypothetical protein